MKIKKTLLIASIVYALLIVNCYSQSVGIGASAFTPDPSAILEVSSSAFPYQGALMPRLTSANRDLISSPATGLLIYNTDCKNLNIYNGSLWVDMVGNPVSGTLPAAPVTDTHTPSQTEIVWNWNAVSGATGYKWGTTNVYSAATDNGANITKTQTGLICNTPYTLYVWAYNNCGNSTSTSLTQTTIACCAASSVTDGSLIKTTTCVGSNTVIKWTYSSSPGSTTWTVPVGVSSVEYLVVGGGGGGGGASYYPGGGGSGGLKTATGFNVSGTINVVVGAGGAVSNNGSSSSFSSINALGGGHGATCNGDQHSTGSTQGTSGDGGVGGRCTQYSSGTGGGGGGTGGAGVSATDSYPGPFPRTDGGIGTTCSITGFPTYYAGGGGGYDTVDTSLGGLGGGGNYGVAGNNGLGGGGGGLYAGGSGVVIISYPTP